MCREKTIAVNFGPSWKKFADRWPITKDIIIIKRHVGPLLCLIKGLIALESKVRKCIGLTDHRGLWIKVLPDWCSAEYSCSRQFCSWLTQSKTSTTDFSSLCSLAWPYAAPHIPINIQHYSLFDIHSARSCGLTSLRFLPGLRFNSSVPWTPLLRFAASETAAWLGDGWRAFGFWQWLSIAEFCFNRIFEIQTERVFNPDSVHNTQEDSPSTSTLQWWCIGGLLAQRETQRTLGT